MKRADVLSFYKEYATYLPVLVVLEAAIDRSNWDEQAWEAYHEQLAEIASERALDGSPTAMSDARRIYDFNRSCRLLRYYAEVAPMHAEACKDIISGLYL